MSKQGVMARLDNYLGALRRVAGNMGTSLDINPNGGAPTLTPESAAWPDLELLYNTRGLAALIVDRPAEDSLARGFEIEEDEDEHLIQQELDRLHAIPVLVDAIRWARLFGGGVVLMLSDDSPSLEFPFDPDNSGEIIGLRDYAVPQLSVADGKYDEDPRSPNFGMPLHYLISPVRGQQFKVHWTRLLIVPGEPMALRGRMSANQTGIPWVGRSALNACIKELRNYYASLQWALRILERKQQGIYAMKGMAEVLETGDEGEKLIKDRLNLIDLSRSIMATVAIDGDDKYDILNLGLDGVQAVINEMQIGLSSSTNMPVTILFGRSPAGMNSTGTSDHQIYNTKVGQYQIRTLKPTLERFVRTLYGQRRLKAKQPQNWQICFEPLWLPTELEQAQAKKNEADAFLAEMQGLNLLIENQGMSAEELRKYLMHTRPNLGVTNPTPPPLPDHLQPPPTPAPTGAA